MSSLCSDSEQRLDAEAGWLGVGGQLACGGEDGGSAEPGTLVLQSPQQTRHDNRQKSVDCIQWIQRISFQNTKNCIFIIFSIYFWRKSFKFIRYGLIQIFVYWQLTCSPSVRGAWAWWWSRGTRRGWRTPCPGWAGPCWPGWMVARIFTLQGKLWILSCWLTCCRRMSALRGWLRPRAWPTPPRRRLGWGETRRGRRSLCRGWAARCWPGGRAGHTCHDDDDHNDNDNDHTCCRGGGWCDILEHRQISERMKTPYPLLRLTRIAATFSFVYFSVGDNTWLSWRVKQNMETNYKMYGFYKYICIIKLSCLNSKCNYNNHVLFYYSCQSA